MRTPAPVSLPTLVVLLDLVAGSLHLLPGAWPCANSFAEQPVPLSVWLRLVEPEDRRVLERELTCLQRLEGEATRQIAFHLRPPAGCTLPGVIRVSAECQVVSRVPTGHASWLRATLRLAVPEQGEPGGPATTAAPVPLGLPLSGARPGGVSDTATFTWTQGAPELPAFQGCPVLHDWLGQTPTAQAPATQVPVTLATLLARLDPLSAAALRAYLEEPEPAGPLERLGELRGGAGPVRPVLLSMQPPLRVGGARVAHGMLRDLGEPVRLHETLAEREELLAEAQALARLGSWRYDLRRRTLLWTDGIFHLLGLPVGTARIETWLHSVHPEDRDRVRAALSGDWPEGRLCLRHRIRHANGEERVVETRGRRELGPDGQPALLYGTTQDVTGQIQAENQDREARRLQAALLDAAATVTATLDRDEVLARLVGSVGRIVPFDAASVMLLGPDSDTLHVLLRRLGPDAPAAAGQMPVQTALSAYPSLAPTILRGTPCVLEDVRTSPAWVDHPGWEWIRSLLLHPILLEGQLLGLLALTSAVPGTFTAEQAETVRLFMGYVRAALHNSQLYEQARHEAHRAGVLADLAAQLNRPLDLTGLAEVVAQGTRAALGRGCVSVARRDPRRQVLYRAAAAGLEEHPHPVPLEDGIPLARYEANRAATQPLPGQPDLSTQVRVFTCDDHPEELAHLGYREALMIRMSHGGQFLASLNVGLLDDAPFTPEERSLLASIAEQAALAFLNAELRAENTDRVRDLTVLNLTAQRFAQLLDETALADALADAAIEHFDSACAWVVAGTPEGRLMPLSPRPQPLAELGPDWPGPHPALAALSGGPVVLQSAGNRAWWDAARARGIQGAAVIPVPRLGREAHEHPRLLLLLSRAPGLYTPQRLHVLSTLVHHFGTALQTARLFGDTRQRLARLEALHDLDTVISSAPDLGQVLRRVAEVAAAQPGVDAVTICLHSPELSRPEAPRLEPRLEYVAARGLGELWPGPTALGGEGPPAVVAREGHPLRVPDVAASSLLGPEAWPRRVGARGYQALPLSAKGQILGVIEYTWHGEEPDPQTQVFLRVLADQAAIASESARLYQDLQRQSAHLARAYDETLEGWSRALDLRDRETEGHTRRVTDLTMRLAQAFGMDAENLAQVRRGALLHDIGKMGIPDAILHKPGPLDPEEWQVMRRHPDLARELLSPIGFLRPALDIPAAHHEKWDGSGYPHGLAGEAIPLSARLFAVVDVWDALTNDRPYRPAWTPERALAHIRAESGTHFDPAVVQAFTALILESYPELAFVLEES
ncbi:hypothetical protein Dcar01_01984 [Deinococcus carri]|uniref:HD-GYP domain-containing protein n=1 Tax=Deinococcus carri TaxID=1211323 RepID=A0ABP9W7C3_9DEIO